MFRKASRWCLRLRQELDILFFQAYFLATLQTVLQKIGLGKERMLDWDIWIVTFCELVSKARSKILVKVSSSCSMSDSL